MHPHPGGCRQVKEKARPKAKRSSGKERGDQSLLATRNPLSPRERQILELMRQGKNNQSIAAELGISVHSVRRHATLIYQKLGVKGRIDIILQDG